MIRDQVESSKTLGMLEASLGSHSTSKQEKDILNDALLMLSVDLQSKKGS